VRGEVKERGKEKGKNNKQVKNKQTKNPLSKI
jgi:hypothetical protein